MLLKIILILIIFCEIWGITAVGYGKIMRSMMYYTQLSNAAALISALLLLVFGNQPWIIAFRYLSVCMLMMTMLVTIFVLVPTIKDTQLLLWSRVGFFLHLVCPVLNLVSYLFLEQRAGWGLLPLPAIVTLIYGDIMLYFNYKRKVDGPYPFLRYHDQSRMATFLWFVVLMFVILGISSGAILFGAH